LEFNALKLLVFEYICGGGMADQALPDYLAAEGRLMLQALIDQLKDLAAIQLIIPLDKRCNIVVPANAEIIWIDDQSPKNYLSALIARSDAVWPLAPESQGLLAEIAQQVLDQNKPLLLSSPKTVKLCSDKLATYHTLIDHNIACVETLALNQNSLNQFPISVLKPIDGLGCEGSIVVDNPQQFEQLKSELTHYICQPYIAGQAVSLSCLFKQGQGWLLTCNQQQIQLKQQQFNLSACLVNVPNRYPDVYQNLIDQIAKALPELWGYIGIDLIETAEQGPLLLEINPRLTTSFVGIYPATGINVAEQVIQLLTNDPQIKPTQQQIVTVDIHGN
jgi:predicted ATP-grasp superfamily ATP-dependent carboligase